MKDKKRHAIRRAPGLWPTCAGCGETIIQTGNAYEHAPCGCGHAIDEHHGSAGCMVVLGEIAGVEVFCACDYRR